MLIDVEDVEIVAEVALDFGHEAPRVQEVARPLFDAHPDAVEQVRGLVVELEEQAFWAPRPYFGALGREALEGHLFDERPDLRRGAFGQIREGVFEQVVKEERDGPVLPQLGREGRLGEEGHRTPDRVDGVWGRAIPLARRLLGHARTIAMGPEGVADQLVEVLHQHSSRSE